LSGKAEEQRLYLIDASIYLFRYYFSMPAHWQSVHGRPTESVYGYALWLLRFLSDVAPRHVAACFDASLVTCFRHEIYADYKISRALPDEDLAFQLLKPCSVRPLAGLSTIVYK